MNSVDETDEVKIEKVCIHGCIAVILKFLLILLLLAGVSPYLPLS